MKKQETYEFTLVLDGVSDQTRDLEDQLFKVGCDDALINFRNGTVYLDFSRSAESFEMAVVSAIREVEASNLGAKVISLLPDNLVGVAEIAKRLKKSRQLVSLWINGERRQKIPFPHPVSKISDKSPMWRWYEVVKWMYEQKLIQDHKIVDVAMLIQSVNVLLEERDPHIKKYRLVLIKKLGFNHPEGLKVKRYQKGF